MMLVFLNFSYLLSMQDDKRLVVRIGAFSMQSRRQAQEDAISYGTQFVDGLGKITYSGVFDGHLGGQVSTMIKNSFFPFCKSCLQDSNGQMDIERILKSACAMCEEKTWGNTAEIGNAGSTLLVSCIEHEKKKLHIAWVGDSRGMLGGSYGYRFITKDHKPSDEVEKSYIQTHGGSISRGKVFIKGNRGWISMSRSIGDIDLKTHEKIGPINPRPDYFQYLLTEEDKYYVEASDGFWDVVDNEEVPWLIYDAKHLDDEEFYENYPKRSSLSDDQVAISWYNDAMKIAARLTYIAVASRNSADNTTVVVKLLDWKKKLDNITTSMCSDLL